MLVSFLPLLSLFPSSFTYIQLNVIDPSDFRASYQYDNSYSISINPSSLPSTPHSPAPSLSSSALLTFPLPEHMVQQITPPPRLRAPTSPFSPRNTTNSRNSHSSSNSAIHASSPNSRSLGISAQERSYDSRSVRDLYNSRFSHHPQNSHHDFHYDFHHDSYLLEDMYSDLEDVLDELDFELSILWQSLV